MYYFHVEYSPVKETETKQASLVISQKTKKILDGMAQKGFEISRLESITKEFTIPAFNIFLREVIPGSREFQYSLVCRVLLKDGDFVYTFIPGIPEDVRIAAKQHGLTTHISKAVVEERNPQRTKSTKRRKDVSQETWKKRIKYKRSWGADFHKPSEYFDIQSRHRNKGRVWLQLDQDASYNTYVYLCWYENQLNRRIKVALLYCDENTGIPRIRFKTDEPDLHDRITRWLNKMDLRKIVEGSGVMTPKSVQQGLMRRIKPDKKTRKENQAIQQRVSETKKIALEVPGQKLAGIKRNYEDINAQRLHEQQLPKVLTRVAAGYKGTRDI